jgi:hypothetical protein
LHVTAVDIRDRQSCAAGGMLGPHDQWSIDWLWSVLCFVYVVPMARKINVVATAVDAMRLKRAKESEDTWEM